MKGIKISNAVLEVCISKIARGDRNALHLLYESTKDALFLFSLATLKNYDAAQDALHDIYIRIMNSPHTYRPGTNPKAWLFTIAKNVCLDSIKKARNEELALSAGIHEIAYSTVENDISGTEEILPALEVLAHAEREIVMLHIFGGFKLTEIAEITSLPYKTVRSKYTYSVKKLKQYYIKRSDIYDK